MDLLRRFRENEFDLAGLANLPLRNGPETTSRFHTDWGTAR